MEDILLAPATTSPIKLPAPPEAEAPPRTGRITAVDEVAPPTLNSSLGLGAPLWSLPVASFPLSLSLLLNKPCIFLAKSHKGIRNREIYEKGGEGEVGNEDPR